tara:strand:+ start:111 stop:965 length:855 start_codon:yes stop_codon:yes gene_type:complete
MDAIFWQLGIAITIFLSWYIGNKVISKLAGLSTLGFWLFWTLGGSALFGFSVLTGPLFFVQMGVIIVVFYLSFKMRKNKNLIIDLKKDLKRFDNKNFQSNIGNISNKQIKVLETPKQHRKMLLKTLDEAKKTIVIFSGWLTDYSVNEEFRNKIKNCLDRGVDIIIAWGYKKSGSVGSENKNKAEKSIKDLQEWTSRNKTKGVLEAFYFPNHSKILICDTKYAVMGSFNWLSNSGGSENEERSYIIYNKVFIEQELVEIMKNLYDPKKPLSRRQLLKNFVPFSRY